jgi:hypothetical protein
VSDQLTGRIPGEGVLVRLWRKEEIGFWASLVASDVYEKEASHRYLLLDRYQHRILISSFLNLVALVKQLKRATKDGAVIFHD